MRTAIAFALLLLLASLAACGGGGGSSSSPSPPPAKSLTITTTTNLAPAVQGHAYSVTLAASNGQGALTWSIAPVSSATQFVDGLSINAQTGDLSGTANFGGAAGFAATVKDSAGGVANKNFTITAYGVLQGSDQSVAFMEYQNAIGSIQVTGGVPPLAFSVTSGSLPPGVWINSALSDIEGGATALGTFHVTVSIQDSFTPPQTAIEHITINVSPPLFSVADSVPGQLLLNRPFSARIVATGGVPPYHFSANGSTVLPPGVAPVDSTGHLHGTPSALGNFQVDVDVTDSSVPAQHYRLVEGFSVVRPKGRNDSPATATPIGNGQIVATLSPYIDPPNGSPFAADHDYYKLVSSGGATVHVETNADRQGFPDTVMEIVDGNGIRLQTCRQLGDTGNNFNSDCLNDDISASPHNQNSALDFQVPGKATDTTTFYVHVFDWSGNARPDMVYFLTVNGLLP